MMKKLFTVPTILLLSAASVFAQGLGGKVGIGGKAGIGGGPSSSCTPAWGGPTVTATPVSWSSGNTIVTTFSSAPATGTFLYIPIAMYNGTSTPPAITSVIVSGSGQSLTATSNSPYAGAGSAVQGMAVYTGIVTAGATANVTVTFATTPTSGGIGGGAFSDSNGCPLVVTDATPTTGSGTSITTPSATAGTANLAFTFVCSSSSITSVNSPWTTWLSFSFVGCLTGYQLSVTGAVSANATNASSTNYNSMLEYVQ